MAVVIVYMFVIPKQLCPVHAGCCLLLAEGTMQVQSGSRAVLPTAATM